MQILHDSYGHLRLAELDLAYILKTLVERRFAERGQNLTIVHKTIGYELRCAPPVAFDCEYVKTLGYGAVEFLLNPDESTSRIDGALVCIVDGQLRYLKFEDLMDPKTKKTSVRPVDISKPAYRVAREYMIRLEREDFENPQRLEKLARAASSQEKPLTTAAFRKKFEHVVPTSRRVLGKWGVGMLSIGLNVSFHHSMIPVSQSATVQRPGRHCANTAAPCVACGRMSRLTRWLSA